MLIGTSPLSSTLLPHPLHSHSVTAIAAVAPSSPGLLFMHHKQTCTCLLVSPPFTSSWVKTAAPGETKQINEEGRGRRVWFQMRKPGLGGWKGRLLILAHAKRIVISRSENTLRDLWPSSVSGNGIGERRSIVLLTHPYVWLALPWTRRCVSFLTKAIDWACWEHTDLAVATFWLSGVN